MPTGMQLRPPGQLADEGDDGFTLVELLIVLLVLGILLGIAIPTFLSATKSAAAATAESNLQIALTAASAYFEENNFSFADIVEGTDLASSLSGQGVALNFVADGPSTVDTTIGAESSDQQVMLVAVAPETHFCYAIFDSRLPSSGLDPFGTTTFGAPPGSGSSILGGTWYGWYQSDGTASGSHDCSVDNAISLISNWQLSNFPVHAS